MKLLARSSREHSRRPGSFRRSATVARGRRRTTKPEGLTASAAVLAKAARILELPIAFSLVPEGDQRGRQIPELDEFVTDANAFWRNTASPFLDQPTASTLAANRRKVLVIAGFSAEVAVLHSALDAIEAGYTVQLPLDVVGRCDPASPRTRGEATPTLSLDVIRISKSSRI
jgi:nicotinamidase-related amidase